MPPEYQSEPHVELFGAQTVFVARQNLREELRSYCIDADEEAFERLSHDTLASYRVQISSRMKINGILYQTFESERKKLSKHSVITLRWVDAEEEEQESYALIKQIIHWNPWPDTPNPFAGVYVRVLWYDTLDKDPFPRCRLSNASGVWKADMAVPGNLIVVPQPEDIVAVVDLGRQFV